MFRFRSISIPATITAALFLLAGAAPAQEGAPADGLMQQVQQKQMEIQQINQQLAQIQQAVVEANPDFADKRDELMADVDLKMIEAGHDPDGARDRIGDLQEELEGGELSAEESQSVTQKIREEQSQLQQAQRQAMQDEAIQSEIESLNQTLIAAMREQNPQTEQLIAQLQTAQQEYQALMQRAMQQQGAMQPPGPDGG